MNNNHNTNKQMRGALLAFVVLQMVYLFFFFIRFPDSFRGAVGMHWGALDAIASWLSTLTMLAYCVTCLWAVAQLVMRKPGFLLWFQISGAVALGGNFLVYVLRQIEDGYYDYEIDYYWVLFIMALFWTVTWCMYFARSSRVFSYMGEDPTYLRMAVLTRNMRPPEPWVERPAYPIYPAPPAGPQYPPAYPAQNQPQPPRPMDSPPQYPMQPGAQGGYAPPPPPAPPVQQAPPVGYPVQGQQPVFPPPAYPPYQAPAALPGQPVPPGQSYPNQP